MSQITLMLLSVHSDDEDCIPRLPDIVYWLTLLGVCVSKVLAHYMVLVAFDRYRY